MVDSQLEIPPQAKFKSLGKVKAEHTLGGASNHLFHWSLSSKTLLKFLNVKPPSK